MNSKIIKYVAGAGKTSFSYGFMRTKRNGLYLAFNNEVVKAIYNKGLLSKTIDALFQSYIIPKLICLVPLIGSNKKIVYNDVASLPNNLKGISNIKIDANGNIYNQQKKTPINLKIPNKILHSMGYFSNASFIKYIFGKSELKLTHSLRADLSNYLLENYPEQIINLLARRFSFIIIDEAQDLHGYREKFAKLIYDSQIEFIVLGDENQNINGGGEWFETLSADDYQFLSYRCPDINCKWIRDNLNIKIVGNDDIVTCKSIAWEDVMNYDDGKRVLLYYSKSGKSKEYISNWKGLKLTIKSAKGSTIDNDIVIIGNNLNDRNLYTAITRTRGSVYFTSK